MPVQQQLAGAALVGDDVGRGRDQRRDLRAEQEHLAARDDRVGFADVGAAGADRLQLPALQGQAGLEALLEVVLVARALVQGDGAAAGALAFILAGLACLEFLAIAPLSPMCERAGAPNLNAAPMPTIRRSALVEHSAARMFALVNDVAAYPRRFDWCEAAQVLEADESHMVARLDLGLGALRTWFTTDNTLEPPHHIDLNLVDGPFRARPGAGSSTRWTSPPARSR